MAKKKAKRKRKSVGETMNSIIALNRKVLSDGAEDASPGLDDGLAEEWIEPPPEEQKKIFSLKKPKLPPAVAKKAKRIIKIMLKAGQEKPEAKKKPFVPAIKFYRSGEFDPKKKPSKPKRKSRPKKGDAFEPDNYRELPKGSPLSKAVEREKAKLTAPSKPSAKEAALKTVGQLPEGSPLSRAVDRFVFGSKSDAKDPSKATPIESESPGLARSPKPKPKRVPIIADGSLVEFKIISYHFIKLMERLSQENGGASSEALGDLRNDIAKSKRNT